MRGETLSEGGGPKQKKPRRSKRIHSTIRVQGRGSNEQRKLRCAVCDLIISDKREKPGVVECTKCENIFHSACSGIQAGWIGHLKFRCSELEIECRKNTKSWHWGKKRGRKGTDSKVTEILCRDKMSDSQGPDEKASSYSTKRPLSPSSRENNSGLTQELQNLEVSEGRSHITTLNNPEERMKTKCDLDGEYNCSNSVPINKDSIYSLTPLLDVAIGFKPTNNVVSPPDKRLSPRPSLTN